MIYNNLFDNFIALFPDDKMWFDNECNKKEVSNEDGMHIVFGMVVVPYLLVIAYKSDEKLQLAFYYIEKMEISGDPQIAEVVEFSILENLIGIENDKSNKLLEFMGDETRKAFEDVKKWYKA